MNHGELIKDKYTRDVDDLYETGVTFSSAFPLYVYTLKWFVLDMIV